MEELKPIAHATSGSMSLEELKTWRVNLDLCIAGFESTERVSEYVGFVSAPSSWNMMHQLEFAAARYGVHITFSNVQTTGFFFKKITFSYRVSGYVSNVNRFAAVLDGIQ